MLEHGSITVRLGQVSCHTNGEHCTLNVVITWGNLASMSRVLKQKLSKIDYKFKALMGAVVLDNRVLRWHDEISERCLYDQLCELSELTLSSNSNSTELSRFISLKRLSIFKAIPLLIDLLRTIIVIN